jgi:hypothetical protein
LRVGLVLAIPFAIGLVVPPARGEPPADKRLVPQTHAAGGTQPALPADVLIGLITQTVAPQSWAVHGGAGTIDFFPQTGSLVINQTPEVHEQIRTLLADLRRHRDEVCLEVRFVTVASDSLEHDGDVRFQSMRRGDGLYDRLTEVVSGTPVALTDKQVHRLLEYLQTDIRTNVLQAPRMTVDNGQLATFRVADEEKFVTGVTLTMKDGSPVFAPKTDTYTCGVELSAWPVASADRRQVRVCLRAALHDLDRLAAVPLSVRLGPREHDPSSSPILFTQKLQQPRPRATVIARTFAVPVGQTMLLDGGTRENERFIEVSSVPGPEFLRDIPFLCDLFSWASYRWEKQRVLVMVTPRIIPRREEVRPSRLAAATPELTRAMVAEVMKRFNTSFKAGRYNESEILAKLACEVDPGNGVCSAALETARMMRLRNELPGPAKVMIPCVCEEIVAEPCPRPDTGTLAELMARYRRACAAGRLNEARELASKALAIDPTCFSKAGKKQP